LETAISFYESLSDEQIERRYSIHYWEECALGAYDSIEYEFLNFFDRSIDKCELARRELKNVDLLLHEGKFQLLISKEHFCINEIASNYEKLLTGTWNEFFNAEELESYQSAHDDHGQNQINDLAKFYKGTKDKENRRELQIEYIKKTLNTGPKFIEYFNLDWVSALQIQALIWYKMFLKKTSELGKPFFVSLTNERKSGSGVKSISMNTLRRSNDGYEAITISFTNFVSKHDRDPQWSELMLYMVENPPDGFLVSGKLRGKKIDELMIEGVEKPIDNAVK